MVYLYNNGWDKWNKSYQTGAIGKLYFSSLAMLDGEKAYIHEGGEGGGRHRFFASKIGNADCIRTEYVDEYRLNTEKLEYYRKITDKEEEIMRFIQNSTLFEKKYHNHKDEKDYCNPYGRIISFRKNTQKHKSFQSISYETSKCIDYAQKIESTAVLQHQWKYHFYPEWHLKKKLAETKPYFEKVFEAMFSTQNKLYTEMFAEYFKWHQRYDYKLKTKKQKNNWINRGLNRI